LGGTYNFDHCTFTNFSNIGNGFRELPTVLIDNNLKVNQNDIVVADLLEANFTNSIIYGNQNVELLLSKIDGTVFNYNFKNCLIKFNDSEELFSNNPLYDFNNTTLFESIILNEEPDFKAPFKNMLNIGENSAANGKAATSTTGTDILGVSRNATSPDIGAYESASFEEN
jgi:hypothetical protein